MSGGRRTQTRRPVGVVVLIVGLVMALAALDRLLP